MDNIKIFPDSGTWCKGNLHTHTSNSDGRLSPAEVVARYKELGHDFIALTDHRVYKYNKDLESDDFIIIPGMEVDLNPPGKNMCHHIVAVRAKISDKNYADGYIFASPEYKGAHSMQGVIDDLLAHDNFAFYCHPIWSRLSPDDYADVLSMQGLCGLEIFNTGCHLENGTGYSPTHTDGALRRGKMHQIFAVDDCHHNQNDRGKGYIVAKASEKSEQAIVSAIINGSFYASRGPEIHDFGIRDGELYISCSNVREIHFIAFEHLGRSFVGETGELINSASCPVNKNWSYVRAEIIDNNGYQAWTNPIYF